MFQTTSKSDIPIIIISYISIINGVLMGTPKMSEDFSTTVGLPKGNLSAFLLGPIFGFGQQWPFQDPKMEVPTIYISIYKAYIMVQYLHFRILEFPLIIAGPGCQVDIHLLYHPRSSQCYIHGRRCSLQWHTICHHLAAESCCDKREPTSKTKSHEILPDFPIDDRGHIFEKEVNSVNSCSLVRRILNHPQFTNFYIFGHHKYMYPQNS